MSKPFLFTKQFKKDLPLLRREDVKLSAKLLELLSDLSDNPFEGLGKPELLKGNLSGLWSRRISDKHHLVYEVTENAVILHACFGHYDDK